MKEMRDIIKTKREMPADGRLQCQGNNEMRGEEEYKEIKKLQNTTTFTCCIVYLFVIICTVAEPVLCYGLLYDPINFRIILLNKI